MHHKRIEASGHFRKVLDASELAVVVEQSVTLLNTVQFDTLAFIGLSGAVLAPILAYKMGKELLMVRKNGGKDNSNSKQFFEGHVTAKRAVVVDDLISSGKTMSQMMYAIQDIKKEHSPDIEVVGLLLHMTINDDEEYSPQLFLPDSVRYLRMKESMHQFNHPVTG